MRNIFILYMPPDNHEAMVHYEDTIRQRVEPTVVYPHLTPQLVQRLKHIFGDRRIAVWGSRSSDANRRKFDRMREGDEVLIVKGPMVKLLARVACKTENPQLANRLWQPLNTRNPQSWDLVYFLANPQEIDVPFSSVANLFEYKPNFKLRGFTGIAQDRLEAFYQRYDDLYSILISLKHGLDIMPVNAELAEASRPVEESAPSGEELATIEPERATTEHTYMQWLLLKLGLQAGGKVWAPRADQSRITRAHQFSDFEPNFSAGLDTQSKYFENIDVVWKDEFRIDGAFEVENSTSIYSGLLRFADLTIVAPNSHYPLFIVAPEERRSRVRDQLARPAFKSLKISDKVRFLSYDRVREIDDFFGRDGRGVSINVMVGKADQLSA